MEQKTIFISGGTSGIGLATAKILLQEGYTVVINGRNKKKGEEALASLSDYKKRVFFVEGDISKPENCQQIIEETIARCKRLDGLVTAAGIYEEELLSNLEERAFDELWAVNVKGTIFLCKAALPYLIKQQGSIVTVSSDAGIQGNVGCSAYCATKGAVVSFTKSLALEMAIHNVRVNCVCPGDVNTPLLERQKDLAHDSNFEETMAQHYPLQRIGEAREIGEVISFLVSSKASFVTGAIWAVDGGLTSW